MLQPVSIIAELEEAVRSGSSAKRISTLRQVTDLFLRDADRLSEDQVRVFDDVLCHLVARVETRVKAEVSVRLASVDRAPSGVIEHLASDDQIEVAGMVLANSNCLTTNTLVEIARTKGQEHLLAISGRTDLTEDVTDVIVDRGERKVIRKLAGNASAQFSENGYKGMVAHAESDDELTEMLGSRIDLPIRFLRDLLQRATEAVRTRLAAIAPAELREEIKRVLKTIANATGGESPPMRDFSRAEAVVRRMKGLNELNDAAISRFAETKIRRSSRVARHSQQQRADQSDGAALGGISLRSHLDSLQIGRPRPGNRRNDPSQSTGPASHCRSDAENRIEGLRQVISGNRRTHGALLAVAR
jgi:Uncharacterised protein conserved in bacteria (DUF2336)